MEWTFTVRPAGAPGAYVEAPRRPDADDIADDGDVRLLAASPPANATDVATTVLLQLEFSDDVTESAFACSYYPVTVVGTAALHFWLYKFGCSILAVRVYLGAFLCI